MKNLNKSRKIVAKLVPLIAALIILITGIIWFIQTESKEIAIPFSAMEKTIQAQ